MKNKTKKNERIEVEGRAAFQVEKKDDVKMKL